MTHGGHQLVFIHAANFKVKHAETLHASRMTASLVKQSTMQMQHVDSRVSQNMRIRNMEQQLLATTGPIPRCDTDIQSALAAAPCF